MSPLLATLLAEADDSSSSGSIISLLFLPAMLVLLYFIMIRPQRRRMKEQQAAQQRLQDTLQVGSEVITAAGIYGTVSGEDGDDVIWLEIDDDVQIRVARAAIQTVLNPDDGELDDADDTADSADRSTSD